MLNRILGPAAAAPLLGLGLDKIARTPRARLAVGYHLMPRLPYCTASVAECPCASQVLAQRRPAKYVAFLALNWAHAQFQLQRRLGAEWAVDRLLAGGIVGERLPLSNLRCEANERGLLPPGSLVDLVA